MSIPGQSVENLKSVLSNNVLMSVDDWIDGLIAKIGGVIVSVIIMVITWLMGTSLESSFPEASATAGSFIGAFFVIVVLYIVCKYGKDWV